MAKIEMVCQFIETVFYAGPFVISEAVLDLHNPLVLTEYIRQGAIIDKNSAIIIAKKNLYLLVDVVYNLLTSEQLEIMISHACYEGSTEVVAELVKRGKVGTYETLEMVVRKGFLPIIKLLIKSGINPESYNSHVLIEAITYRKFKIVKYLIEEAGLKPDIQENLPLLTAVTANDVKIFDYLISKGADIRERYVAIIHGITKYGLVDFKLYLLEKYRLNVR